MTTHPTLEMLRQNCGKIHTPGLKPETVAKFLQTDPQLGAALEQAATAYKDEEAHYKQIAAMDELEAAAHLQQDIINFYPDTQVNPYIALAAQGPWIITLHGGVIHDSGGYGMLGFGHGPKAVREAMAKNQVMANVMTPSASHLKISRALQCELAYNRADKKAALSKFLFVNSGSESMSVALRISDLNAKALTDTGGRWAGRRVKFMAHLGGFHGRTDRPAQASSSTSKAYRKLASFRERENLITIEPNDSEGLRKAFAAADAENVFIEALLMEPVMGEGRPGVSITPEYYQTARELTAERGTLLIVDSIQAGLRGFGCLSVMGYPGFEKLAAPDMETYSKAINGGQYPLSVLAMQEQASEIYQRGVYGNTMTANPRAMDVGCAVLEMVTGEIRNNIRERGKEFLERFEELRKEFPDVVTDISGTGLLCAIHLKKEGFQVVGDNGVELAMRKQGIGVIHGGENALRFTPHFAITSAEIDLVIDIIRDCLKQGPVYS